MTPQSLPVTILDGGSFAVTFPCGARVTFTHTGGGYLYEGTKANGQRVEWKDRTIPDREHALALAWAAVHPGFPPLDLEQAVVHAEALACNHDVKRFTATLKRYLRARTGVTFSVTKGSGRGLGSGWVDVREYGQGSKGMSPGNAAALQAMFGHIALGSHMSVRPDGGERVSVICKAAGVPLPDGFVVREPAYD